MGIYNTTDKPENSLAAIKAAISKAHPFEIDVMLSSDDEVIVFHDARLARMTGADGYTAGTALADLKKLRLGSSSETIPTLKEVLELVKGKVPVLIEIKARSSRNAGVLEQAVMNCLKGYNGEYAIQSYNPLTIEWLKKHYPEVKRGLISGYFKLPNEKEATGWLIRFVLKRMWMVKRTKPHFICYDSTYIPNRHLRKTRKLPLLAYGVKTQTRHNELLKYADNVIFEGYEPK